MSWKTSYILVRPSGEAQVSIVHSADKLKDARYWLQYIAQSGDAIFTTPIHAQYKGSGDPTYMCHLIARGKMDYNEAQWKSNFVQLSDPAQSLTFSTEVAKEVPKEKTSEQSGFSETEIVQLLDGKPKPLSLTQLKSLMHINARQLEILLAEPTKWIDWESALTLMTRDVYIISVNPESQWPLTVTLKPEDKKGETMDYDAKMNFMVRPRAA